MMIGPIRFVLLLALACFGAGVLHAQYNYTPFTLTPVGTTAVTQNLTGAPAGTWVNYTVTCTWSAIAGFPYSDEARLSFTDGGTTTYLNEVQATSGASSTTTTTNLTWTGSFLVTFPGGATTLQLRARQTWSGSTATWTNIAVTITAPSPEINVQRASTDVLHNTTDFLGSGFTAGTGANVTYTIQNLSPTVALNIASITTQGTPVNCSVSYGALTPASPIAAGGTNSATFVVTVTPTAGGLFSFTISIDNDDTTGNEDPYLINVTGAVPLTGAQTFDFEGATGGNNWVMAGTHGSLWQRGTPSVVGPAAAHGGSQCFGTVINGDYAVNSAQAYLISPAMSLAGFTAPQLRFWHWMDAEGTTPWWDGGVLQVSTNGVNWTTVSQTDAGWAQNAPDKASIVGCSSNPGWGGTGANASTYVGGANDWREVVLNLFSMTSVTLTTSSNVSFRYWFGSDTTVSNFPGWYIDDVSLAEAPQPEIEIFDAATGGTSLTDGGTITGVNVGTTGTTLTFRIENQAAATGNLVLPSNPVTFSVTAGAGNVSVSVTQPGSLNLAPGASTTFTVTITATNNGAYTVEVDVANNDGNENPFDIGISGTATSNNPPNVTINTTGSTPQFTGTANTGPFSLAVDPGQNITSLLDVSDPDTGHNVRIVNITPATAQIGVTATAPAGYAASQSITFSGTVSAAATPGTNYTWTFDVEDDQTTPGTRSITVHIVVNNIAPDAYGNPAAGVTGDGDPATSPLNPYAITFNQGTTVSTTALFTVTDANTGQTLTISSATRTGAAGPTTFPFDGRFTITGAAGSFTVNVDTAGNLAGTDVGVHDYDVVVLDQAGGNSVTVKVSLTVAAQTPPTFTPNATGVSIGQGGFMANVDVGTVADAQGLATVTGVAAITVPTGITVSAISIHATTGVVTCTIAVGPAVAATTHNITFEATDNTAQTGTGVYTFTVIANAAPVITAAAAKSVAQGGSLTATAIATVSDADQMAGSLTVTVQSAPAGITLSSITNTTGNVTATIAASASATLGANTVVLLVTDAQGATSTANLTVNVFAAGAGGGGGGGDGGCSSSPGNSWLVVAGLLAALAVAWRRRKARA